MIYFNNLVTRATYNIALEQFVHTELDLDEDVLLLWVNHNAIIIGRNQNAYEEINIDAAARDGVTIVRRNSGGGAVYHDKGNLNFTFIVNKNKVAMNDYKKMLQPLVEALNSLGLYAIFAGKNDVEVDGMKISGNAQYLYKDKLMHHGTLLFDVDLTKLQHYLKPNKVKVSTKGIQSVRARVTNILPLLKKKITIEEFRDLIKSKILSSGGKVMDFTPEQIKRINEIEKTKFALWEHNFAKSPEYEFKNQIYFNGVGLIDVRAKLEEGKIAKIKILGDFMALQDIEDVEQALTGIELNKEQVLNSLKNLEIHNYFGKNFKPEMLLEVLFS